MDFMTIAATIEPKLRQLAVKYCRIAVNLDGDDLFDEMMAHLWERWRAGALEGKTESYIVQSCYFHMRNYIRVSGRNRGVLSIDDTCYVHDSGDEGVSLADTVNDGTRGLDDDAEGRELYETIMNNGFRPVEKEVVRYLTEGLTVREIGVRLHISHAMVLKHKKNIADRVTRKYSHLLV